MIVRKIALCSLLCITMPSTAYWNIGVSLKIPITKKTLLVGAAIGGSVLAAAFLYKYFTTMTLPKAERLCDDVSSFVEEVTSKYHQEFAAIDHGCNDERLKVELQNIITSGDSESPYLNYTNNVRSMVKKAELYEERFSKGIPQLKAALDYQLQQLKCAVDDERSYTEAEIERYQNVFHTIALLRELLHAVRFKMQRLVRLCMQFDAYRQEKILERLQAIETEMLINSMQPKTVNHYHCYRC